MNSQSRFQTTIIILSTVLALSQFVHAAPLIYQSQNRFIRTALSADLFEQMSADDLSEFDAALDSFFNDGIRTGNAAASQSSSLFGSSIIANGTARGSTGAPVGTSNATGNSHFEVSFQVTDSHEFELMFHGGQLSEFGRFTFQGPSVNFDSSFGLTGGGELVVSEGGTIQPGEYLITTNISNGGAAAGLVGSFDLQFHVVPEPRVGLFVICVTSTVLLTRRTRFTHGLR